MSRLTRLITLGLLAVPISTAVAHTSVRSSSPPAGSTIRAMPPVVTITLASPPIRLVTARVARRGADVTKSARLNPRNARQIQITTRPAKPGVYTASWMIIGPDGHRVSGKITFTVRR